jgi:hypothetical protein
MNNDLYAATKYKLKVTSSFRDLISAVRDFKKKYSPIPWLTKYDSRYPNYFDDKPGWRRNYRLYLNNHDFGQVPMLNGMLNLPRLEDYASNPLGYGKYGGMFVGNDYVKYWWENELYPIDSGKWWYKKPQYSKRGDPPMATPGMSNHGWGISVDLDGDIFKNKKAVDWMALHMLDYGWSRETFLSDDDWHITYYPVSTMTPLVSSRMEDIRRASVIKPVLNKVNPSIVSATKKVSSTPALASLPIKQIVVNRNNNSATPNFYSSNSSNSISNNFLGFFERAIEVSSDLALEVLFNRRSLFGKDDSVTKLNIFIDALGLHGPLYQLDAIDRSIPGPAAKPREINIGESNTFKFFANLSRITKNYVTNPDKMVAAFLSIGLTVTIDQLDFLTDFFDRFKAPDPTFTSPATLSPETFSTNFNVSSRKSSTPLGGGGGAFGRQATVTSSKFTVLPGLKNLDGLSPKIFQPAQPYRGSSEANRGGYLTYDEYFEMMIHPLIGNFSFAVAAVLTGISSREGNYTYNQIGIGVANGSEHMGFFQLRCKPEKDYNDSFDKKNGWLGSSLLWSVPYNANGEPDLTKNNKKYAWEAFIKDENIIKEIKAKGSSSSPAAQKSAIALIEANHPVLRKNAAGEDIYDLADKINASSYLAEWARIPANQVWMMKSKFSLSPDYLVKQNATIKFPYTPQMSIVTDLSKPWPQKGFMLNPWNVDGENTWKHNVDVNVTFNVLVNWFKKYGVFSLETNTKPTQAQAETRALKELTDLSSYMESGKKKAFNSWLLGID